jgi:hypothetical protein
MCERARPVHGSCPIGHDMPLALERPLRANSSPRELIRFSVFPYQSRTGELLYDRTSGPLGAVKVSCCRFDGHRDWVFHEAGGGLCRDEDSAESSRSRQSSLSGSVGGLWRKPADVPNLGIAGSFNLGHKLLLGQCIGRREDANHHQTPKDCSRGFSRHDLFSLARASPQNCSQSSTAVRQSGSGANRSYVALHRSGILALRLGDGQHAEPFPFNRSRQ